MPRYQSVIFRHAHGRPAVLAATVLSTVAVVMAPGVSAEPAPTDGAHGPVVELAGAPIEALSPAPEAPVPAEEAEPARASLSLAAGPAEHPNALPPGDVSEAGLQVETIRLARNISADFPEVHSMIGVRPDAKPWHPSGKALDIMIPNAGSAEGIALGDAIMAYALGNAAKFGIQDVIWRGSYYTPAGPGGSGYGHYDHVHITTLGGGFPSGSEQYLDEA